MKEYYPVYIKDNFEKKKNCPKCNKNNYNIKKILLYSYLEECKKCSRMGLYGENQMSTINNINIPLNNYRDICTCEKKYIYSSNIKCNNCSKCSNCNNELNNYELKNIKDVLDNHLCTKCYKKINYNISENINY